MSVTWEFSLPPPPSVNRTRRINGAAANIYARWQDAAGWTMREQGYKAGTPWDCAVEVILRFPRTADLDNRIKAMLDLMTRMGVYRDDRQVVRLVAEFHDRKHVEIEVRILA